MEKCWLVVVRGEGGLVTHSAWCFLVSALTEAGRVAGAKVVWGNGHYPSEDRVGMVYGPGF